LENIDEGNAQDAKITMDDRGNAFAVWNQQSSGMNSIWSNNYDISSGWGTSVLLETDNRWNAHAPDVAAGADGAMAIWNQFDGTNYNIYSNRYQKDSGWGTPELIEKEDEGSASRSQIATDGSGNYIAVWRQFHGGTLNIWANIYTPDTGWRTERAIETLNSGEGDIPRIAMSSSGTALVVWEQFYNDVRLIASNRFVLPDTIPPVLDVDDPPRGYVTEWSEINVYGTTDPGITLTVNGYLVDVSDDGSFSCNISLRNGDNKILVKAVDGSGNTALHLTNVTFNDPVISLKEDMMKALDDIATLTLEISDLRSDHSDMALLLAGLRNDLDINMMNLSQIEENLTLLNTEIGTLTEELHSILENLTSVVEKVENHDEDLDLAYSDIADLILELDRINDTIDEMEDDVQDTAAVLEELSSSIAITQGFDDLSDELDSTKDELDSVKTVNTILIILIIILFIVVIAMFFMMMTRTKRNENEIFE
jgi:hypothetical protein